MINPGKIRINNRLYTCENMRELLHSLGNEPWVISLIDFLINWFDNSSCIEVKTSGSTGEPKVIALTKESMMNSAKMTCRFFNLNEESTALMCLPADYIAGKMMVVRAFVSNLNLIAVKPSADPFVNLDTIVDFAAITPYQFINAYQSIQVAPVRKIIVGGSQVSLRLQKLMENLDTEFYETYGMTETCSHIALRKLNGNNASFYFEALPGISISLDERDCLKVDAPALTEKTLVTNDVVEMIDENHFKWLGRFDNVINSGGIKIFPEQVEKKIEPFIERRFFIGALPDEMLNQKVVLFMEGDVLSLSEEYRLQQNFDTVLSRFEKPKQIIYKEAFEVSSSGKILKNKIIASILS